MNDAEQVKKQLAEAEKDARFLQAKYEDVADVKRDELEKTARHAQYYGSLSSLYHDLQSELSKAGDASKIMQSMVSISSGASALKAFRQFVESKSASDFNHFLLTQTLASTAVLSTSATTIALTAFPAIKGSPYIEVLTGQDLEKRKFVQSKLPAPIGNIFAQAWQSFEQGNYDPERGASFLMRETVSHFLHNYAPDQQIESQAWFKAHEGASRIWRDDRIEFIARKYFPEDQQELRKRFFRNLIDIYNDLNEAHKPRPLERENCDAALQTVTNVFYSFYLSQER